MARIVLLYIALSIAATSAAFAQDSYRDPAGDAKSATPYVNWPDPALRLPTGYRSPDIVAVESRLEGHHLLVTVRFAPGTYDPDRTIVHIGIDADRDAETGSTLPGWARGFDYEAHVRGSRPSTVRPYRMGFQRVEAEGVMDGIAARIPLREVSPSQSGVELSVAVYVLLTGGARTTGSLDYAPDHVSPNLRISVATGLPDWTGTWSLAEAARGGGPPEFIRFHADGTGVYETRFWRGMAPFRYVSTGDDRLELRGLPRGWTASAQRFRTGGIQLMIDRGGGSVALLPFNRLGVPTDTPVPASPASRPPTGANPFVGRWTEANTGAPLEVFADGRVVITLSGSARGTHTLRYTRDGITATLTGYPGGTATMRIGETGTLFINYTTSGSRGMAMYRRASQ